MNALRNAWPKYTAHSSAHVYAAIRDLGASAVLDSSSATASGELRRKSDTRRPRTPRTAIRSGKGAFKLTRLNLWQRKLRIADCSANEFGGRTRWSTTSAIADVAPPPAAPNS